MDQAASPGVVTYDPQNAPDQAPPDRSDATAEQQEQQQQEQEQQQQQGRDRAGEGESGC